MAEAQLMLSLYVSFFKRKNIRLQGYICKEQQCDVFQNNSN